MSHLVQVQSIDDGRIWRVVFGGGKGNILTGETLAALGATFRDAAQARALRAICLEGAGPDFSYGASVQEHLPAGVEAMLRALGDMAMDLIDSHVFVVAIVRGRCLGGGLELASLCHRVVASSDAQFGQPEMSLGVFPPLASIVLPERVGRACAEDLCLSGRTIRAADARAMGLVDEVVSHDPGPVALAWVREHLTAKSAASLRYGVRAIRTGLTDRLRRELPALETLYLEELMKTADALEGLTAFIEKRPPAWRDA